MSSALRTLALLGAIIGLSCTLTVLSADAATKTHHVSKKHKRAKKNTGATKLRTAQQHLSNLGYYKGKVDGRNGPKTKAAIRAFQREHRLSVTGKLTDATYKAIIAADRDHAMSSLPFPTGGLPPAEPKFYADHPDAYGHFDQNFENAGARGYPVNVYSRFAKLDMIENNAGAMKRYNIMMNGQPLAVVDGQPTVIGVSKTYEMGNEDAIILTSYQDSNPSCIYAHNLLIISERGSRTLNIQNCTRGYQAKMNEGSLFITFPEADDNRDVGATWRYENGDLERL